METSTSITEPTTRRVALHSHESDRNEIVGGGGAVGRAMEENSFLFRLLDSRLHQIFRK